MSNILHIDSSIFSGDGVSSTLARQFVETLAEHDRDIRVRHRDLGREPIPHLDAERLNAINAPPGERSPEQQQIAEETERLTRELQEADVLVLGAPMYNFAVPTQLKAWFDHVARAGVTFRYTGDGPEGLLKGKKAVIFTSRGGLHRGRPSDSQTAFLTTMLEFLGIADIEVVYAEGLNLGETPRRQALRSAAAELHQLAAA
jgi:FMN-dependent NADH-azoreductase